MALFAMIPLGVGEILGGIIMANVSDKLGYHKTIKILLVITLIAFGVLFVTLTEYKFSVLTFFMTFTWGL
jgi:hypothetical protein